VVGIGVVLVGIPWAIWVLTGPQRRLPAGSIALFPTQVSWYDLALSRDGRYLAFCYWPEAGRSSVVRLDLDTRDWEIIGAGVVPVWLPDDSLVYFRDARSGGSSALMRVERNGTTEWSLPEIHLVYRAIADPRRAEIYLADMTATGTDSRPGFFRISLDSRSVEPIQWTMPYTVDIDLNADGTRWVIHESGPQGGQLALYDVQRHLEKVLSVPGHRGPKRCPRVSPDGRYLAFVQAEETPRSLAIERTARGTSRVSRSVNLSWRPAVSLFQLSWRSTGSRVDVYNLETGDREGVATFRSSYAEVLWHPDGKHLIAQGDGHLWLIPLPEHLWSKPAPGFKPN